MTEEGKLVERLLAIDSSHIGDGRYCNWPRNPDGHEAAARITDLERRLEVIGETGQFLLDRIGQLEWMEDGYEALCRDWMGHVEPAIARFRQALTEIGASHE